MFTSFGVQLLQSFFLTLVLDCILLDRISFVRLHRIWKKIKIKNNLFVPNLKVKSDHNSNTEMDSYGLLHDFIKLKFINSVTDYELIKAT